MTPVYVNMGNAIVCSFLASVKDGEVGDSSSTFEINFASFALTTESATDDIADDLFT